MANHRQGNSFKQKNSPEDLNPCYKEQELSYECLSKNNYDNSKCSIHFENYKACKTFWNNIRLERLRQGIHPEVPSVEERQNILKERAREKKVFYERSS